jgi:hypothetical protein
MPRSCAFSASSCSSSPLEICLFESPLGWRRRSRATCRLTTFFILFDRAISFMNRPPPVPNPQYPPSVNNRWSNRRAALGSDTAFPQRPAVGAPSIQQCSELKPPEHSRRPTSNSSDSSRHDCRLLDFSGSVLCLPHSSHAAFSILASCRRDSSIRSHIPGPIHLQYTDISHITYLRTTLLPHPYVNHVNPQAGKPGRGTTRVCLVPSNAQKNCSNMGRLECKLLWLKGKGTRGWRSRRS